VHRSIAILQEGNRSDCVGDCVGVVGNWLATFFPFPFPAEFLGGSVFAGEGFAIDIALEATLVTLAGLATDIALEATLVTLAVVSTEAQAPISL
jgi:hypothetical protein